MLRERSIDPADLYRLERRAFVALLRTLSPEELTRTVPATPLWSVRDVLAHVVGITADLNAQRFGDGDADEWTATQVLSRRGASIDQLADEWEREGPTFESGLRIFGYDFGAHYLGDLLQHVLDVHAAIGRRPVLGDNLVVASDFYLRCFDEALNERSVGVVIVDVGDEQIVLGSGSPTVTLRASRLELFRALGGRRTHAEIAALEWSGNDAEAVDLVNCYTEPDHPLGERSTLDPDRPVR
ncbi:MAG: maleylpyruvate isomerase family mycothiol-dependent enzyme [Ilumatobacteraceae bacterium]